SSVGRPNVLTSRAGPPSTLTVAMPILRPRLPIQRMEVPLKVIEAVAPAIADCTAPPPLHPQLASLRIHGPVNVTEGCDSSTRLGSSCCERVISRPKGWRVIVFTCVTPLRVAL